MDDTTIRCNVCGGRIEDRGYKHTQCRYCGQVSNLCCDPETPCVAEGDRLVGQSQSVREEVR